MANALYNQKKLKGFTLVELLIALACFSLIFGCILETTLRSYIFYRNVYAQADQAMDLNLLSLQIRKGVKFSSSFTLDADNHGFHFFRGSRIAEIFFRQNALWKKEGGTTQKLPCSYPLLEANFVLKEGKLIGFLRTAEAETYLEEKLP